MLNKAQLQRFQVVCLEVGEHEKRLDDLNSRIDKVEGDLRNPFIGEDIFEKVSLWITPD